MGLFRRKASDSEVLEDQLEGLADADDTDADPSDEDGSAPADPPVSREDGPWDISEFEANPDGITRLDLGGILMPGIDGMQLQMQSEYEGGPIVAITAILGNSAMQVQPFAAPKSGGYWATVREEILENLEGSAKAREVRGSFGVELHAVIPAVSTEGQTVLQPARFVGIDGPRWFLRAVFLGEAAVDASAGADLEEVLRQVVVRRGAEAMGRGAPIPMHLPLEVPEGINPADEQAAASGRDDLNPFERGPEITEIR